MCYKGLHVHLESLRITLKNLGFLGWRRENHDFGDDGANLRGEGVVRGGLRGRGKGRGRGRGRGRGMSFIFLSWSFGMWCRFWKLLFHLFQVIMNTPRVSETLSRLTVLFRSPQNSVPTWFITMMTAARSRCTLWMKNFWKNISNDRCEYYSLVSSVWICTLGPPPYLWPFHF